MDSYTVRSPLKKAQKIIPGGNQLLSKRSEMFLPGLWPTYYRSSQGCVVSDLNKKLCPDCTSEIDENSKFCRMCGKFPID